MLEHAAILIAMLQAVSSVAIVAGLQMFQLQERPAQGACNGCRQQLAGRK